MTIQELYFKTLFCCMACDGDIANEEVAMVREMASGTDLFGDLDVESSINKYVEEINTNGVTFLNCYLKELSATELSNDEQLVIISIAVKTIKADNKIKYSEVKFFKKIRNKLSLEDEIILTKHPDIEDWLLLDINVAKDPVWDNVIFGKIDLSIYDGG